MNLNFNSKEFANEWIDSWNSHDIERILKHYSEDIKITTPMIKDAGGINKGSLQGKNEIREYWTIALKKIPDLNFKLIDVVSGVESVALYYDSVMGKKAIEVMFLNKQGKIQEMIAHYS